MSDAEDRDGGKGETEVSDVPTELIRAWQKLPVTTMVGPTLDKADTEHLIFAIRRLQDAVINLGLTQQYLRQGDGEKAATHNRQAKEFTAQSINQMTDFLIGVMTKATNND